VLSALFSGLKGRILADGAARVWNAALSFLLVPVYLRFVGVEAYGLIGVLISIQTILALLDFGLGASLTRELARTAGQGGDWVRARNLARTLEVVYWGLAALAALSFCLAVPWIASTWLKPEQLTTTQLRNALYVGAAAIGMQWAGTLYSGGLLGLQRQRPLAIIGVIATAARAAGTVFVLWAIAATVEAMFWVQAAVGLVNTLVLMWTMWALMPGPAARPQFHKALLREVWSFATGVSAIALTSMILMQTDKILLSKLLPLEQFGYYMLASALAGGLYVLVAPLFATIFARLSELVAKGDEKDICAFYHLASQTIAVVVLPVAAVLFFFAAEALLAWTGTVRVAEQSSRIVALLVAGNAFNALICAPYAFQLANGWTKLPLILGSMGIVMLVALMLPLVSAFGAEGAAASWAAMNFGVLLVCPWIMHRSYLRSELAPWLANDVGLPLLAAISSVWLLHAILPRAQTRVGAVFLLVLALAGATAATLVASTLIRSWVLNVVSLAKGHWEQG
jgi:O-antigen/teichoic acid export membrane protein